MCRALCIHQTWPPSLTLHLYMVVATNLDPKGPEPRRAAHRRRRYRTPLRAKRFFLINDVLYRDIAPSTTYNTTLTRLDTHTRYFALSNDIPSCEHPTSREDTVTSREDTVCLPRLWHTRSECFRYTVKRL